MIISRRAISLFIFLTMLGIITAFIELHLVSIYIIFINIYSDGAPYPLCV